nr:tetratricopeptide repeat protein [Clostridium botulinum]
MKDYTNALKLTPENKNIYLNRGTIYYKIKNYENAISDYMKALNCKEKDPSFYHKIYTNCNDKLNKKILPFVNFK